MPKKNESPRNPRPGPMRSCNAAANLREKPMEVRLAEIRKTHAPTPPPEGGPASKDAVGK